MLNTLKELLAFRWNSFKQSLHTVFTGFNFLFLKSKIKISKAGEGLNDVAGGERKGRSLCYKVDASIKQKF